MMATTTKTEPQLASASSTRIPEGEPQTSESTPTTSDAAKTDEQPTVRYWKLAREGVSLLLNNKQHEAEALFKAYPDSLEMNTGYVYAVVTDALMTFEDDKIQLSLRSMKELEKKCSAYYSNSWLKLVKSKVFGSDCGSTQRELECQIILADTHVFAAMFTFLQQDISGFIKGGWILRKSYNYYHSAYNTILEIYKVIVGDDNIPSLTGPTSSVLLAPPPSTSTEATTAENTDNQMTIEQAVLMASTMERREPIDVTLMDPAHRGPPAPTAQDSNYQNLQSSNRNREASKTEAANTKKVSSSVLNARTMDRETISRLLCEVSFGYGLLQLAISLLPPTMFKLVSFFGFNGNRKVGIENLMYARKGNDLRAPFATLALLWYHTIVRPFFALDGTNVNAGTQIAAELLDEVKEEFAVSALFLFFRGRVERLKSEIPEAIETFQLAITNAAQNELKLMSMHEVGWCYLIELNFSSAEISFIYLKDQSRWSKPFYSYLCLISAGSNRMFQEVQSAVGLRNVFQPVVKGTQLDEFLTRRYKICPLEEGPLRKLDFVFWKILSYELLYLWNTLPSCNRSNVEKMISDCDEAWTIKVEPFVGLSRLVGGSCLCILGRHEDGIKYFREGIEARKTLSFHGDDAHVSAFTKYELGLLLIRNPATLPEGKQLLESVSSNYKGYDFEQRLTVRVHQLLKSL